MAAKQRHLVLVILLAVFLISPIGAITSPGIPITRSVEPERTIYDINVGWLTDLVNFIGSVKNGMPDELVGVYVAGVLALPVVQQPEGDLYAVSSEPGVVTQYGSAARSGSVGLLAHNNLAGAQFINLAQGQTVTLVYGNGHSRDYTITSFRQFQATIPDSPYSSFIDLDDPNGAPIHSSDLFTLIYGGGERVIFQTCIARDGDASWGRLFVIATPTEPGFDLFHLPLVQWLTKN